MTEEEIKLNLEDNEQHAMQIICDTLSTYENKARVYLADFVAALCHVEKGDMFSTCNNLDIAQARWLFWYAYRYMTNETYEKIGNLSRDIYGKAFTKVGVSSSVNKMARLIANEPIWTKRWAILKRIIKEQNPSIAEPPVPITITIPKNVELTIKKE